MANPARILAAIIALFAWTGLGIQLDASAANTGSVAAAVWVMLRYFTIIANLLVAIVFTTIALDRAHFATARRIGGVTIAIMLVGIVYGLLLRGLVELSGGAVWADLINHKITPLLVTLYWFMLLPRGGVGPRDPLIWTILPIAYFVYAMVRGAWEGIYAYPFFNVDRIGWGGVAAYAIAMAAGFLTTGYAMYRFDQWRSRTVPPDVRR